MKNISRAGGISTILFVLGFAAWFALEMHRSNLGFEDADNPAVSIAFLKQHSDIYTLTGIAFVLMGVTLVVSALAVWDIASTLSAPLTLKFGTVFGLISAAYFFGQGVLRVQSPGTLLHMAGLNPEWGLAAYLAVQMAGTQGLGSTGMFALSVWAIGISLAALRSRIFPLPLSLLGAVPAIHLLLGFFGPLIPLLEALRLLYVASIFGVMLWCIVLGVMLLRWQPVR